MQLHAATYQLPKQIASLIALLDSLHLLLCSLAEDYFALLIIWLTSDFNLYLSRV